MAQNHTSTELLKQNANSPVRAGIQAASLFALNKGILDDVEVDDVRDWIDRMTTYLEAHNTDLLEDLQKGWDDELKEKLGEAVKEFTKTV